jgi:hypothetical protein
MAGIQGNVLLWPWLPGKAHPTLVRACAPRLETLLRQNHHEDLCTLANHFPQRNTDPRLFCMKSINRFVNVMGINALNYCFNIYYNLETFYSYTHFQKLLLRSF